MIELYSGTPGSGKSLHVAREVETLLIRNKRNVIANFPINMKMITKDGKRKTGQFIYLKNDELTSEYLMDYARKNHKVGIEGQSYIIIDEAGILFNSRDWSQWGRKGWINFLMTHRHYGFNVIMVSQNDRLIDRQIRAFIEYDVKHRKANNYKTIGFILTVMRIPTFVGVTYWYGMHEKCGSQFFRYRKRDSKLYDTMMLFEGDHHGETIGMEKLGSESIVHNKQNNNTRVVPIKVIAAENIVKDEQKVFRSSRTQKLFKQQLRESRKVPVEIFSDSECEGVNCIECIIEKKCRRPDKYWTPYMEREYKAEMGV